MIERKFVSEFKREFLVEEFIRENLKGVGHSMTKVKKTPLGEKIIIYSSRPGLVVGRAGSNIKKLTKQLKAKFNFENPQIEIAEIENVNLDPQLVAEKISTSLERFGVNKFKGIMHKAMTDVMNSGARGIEIHLSGKLPSSRAKTWRVYSGYLKKCGEVALTQVRHAQMQCQLKSGIVGIKISIMPPDVILPDQITIADVVKDSQVLAASVQNSEEKSAEEAEKPKKAAKKRTRKTKEQKETPEEKTEAKIEKATENESSKE